MKYQAMTRLSTQSRQTLFLLHGLGSDERDMFGLAQMLDPHVEVICLRAPSTYGPGYAWFDIQWTSTGIHVDEDEFWTAVGSLAHEILSYGIEQPMVGGFSQGAMMSLGLATRYPQVPSAIALLSGRGFPDPAAGFTGPIFQAHGKYDDVIPIADARQLNLELKSHGDRYEYHEYEMGHWIDESELRDFNRWLAARL